MSGLVMWVHDFQTGLWMNTSGNSAQREIAECCMRSLGLDMADYRRRDKLIKDLSPLVMNLLASVQTATEKTT